MDVLFAIYRLCHNAGVFHNFLVAANWIAHSCLWNFRVASTANWLGNPCALLCPVMEYLHVITKEKTHELWRILRRYVQPVLVLSSFEPALDSTQ